MEAGFSVAVTQTAEDELVEIRDFIARDSPRNAHRFVARVAASFGDLAFFPTSHPIAPESPHNGEIVRHCFPDKSYRVLFVVRKHTVVVIHVRHASRERKFPAE